MADETKNVRISILKHFETQLAGTSAIDLPGTNLNTKDLTEWFRPRLFGPASGAARRGERNELWTLDVNCFAKIGLDKDDAPKESVHRAWELADAVIGVFSQADIALQNWAGVGDPTIATLRFEEANAVQIEDLKKTSTDQVNVTIVAALIF